MDGALTAPWDWGSGSDEAVEPSLSATEARREVLALRVSSAPAELLFAAPCGQAMTANRIRMEPAANRMRIDSLVLRLQYAPSFSCPPEGGTGGREATLGLVPGPAGGGATGVIRFAGVPGSGGRSGFVFSSPGRRLGNWGALSLTAKGHLFSIFFRLFAI